MREKLKKDWRRAFINMNFFYLMIWLVLLIWFTVSGMENQTNLLIIFLGCTISVLFYVNNE